jgi:hypothetical protein
VFNYFVWCIFSAHLISFSNHLISLGHIFAFQDLGMVEIVEEESEYYLEEENPGQLERMVRICK